MTKKAITIDMEPKWVDLARLCIKPEFVNDIMPALKIADIVRQAQKQGKSKVIFTFSHNKEAAIQVI